MMTQLIALSPTQHARSRYITATGYPQTAHQPITPALLAELPKLAAHYVLAFMLFEDHFRLVALLGLAPDQNLYLAANDSWLAPYIPASVRGYPFVLAPREDGQLVFCLHQEFLADDDRGEPIFDDQGQLQETPKKALEFLTQRHANSQVTAAAVAQLQQANVVTPWDFTIPRENETTPFQMSGLYCIDQTALNALDQETYFSLRGDAMVLAHAQLFSMKQISQLTIRFEQHMKLKYPQENTVPDLEQLFGEKDNDLFKFN